jgi:hypothetical protein
MIASTQAVVAEVPGVLEAREVVEAPDQEEVVRAVVAIKIIMTFLFAILATTRPIAPTPAGPCVLTKAGNGLVSGMSPIWGRFNLTQETNLS